MCIKQRLYNKDNCVLTLISNFSSVKRGTCQVESSQSQIGCLDLFFPPFHPGTSKKKKEETSRFSRLLALALFSCDPRPIVVKYISVMNRKGRFREIAVITMCISKMSFCSFKLYSIAIVCCVELRC